MTRQTGSHLWLTTLERVEHHVTVPRHVRLGVGTLACVLGDAAQHSGLTREALARWAGTRLDSSRLRKLLAGWRLGAEETVGTFDVRGLMNAEISVFKILNRLE